MRDQLGLNPYAPPGHRDEGATNSRSVIQKIAESRLGRIAIKAWLWYWKAKWLHFCALAGFGTWFTCDGLFGLIYAPDNLWRRIWGDPVFVVLPDERVLGIPAETFFSWLTLLMGAFFLVLTIWYSCEILSARRAAATRTEGGAGT